MRLIKNLLSGYKFHSGQMSGAVCAVDIPDASCHWYIAEADNTFGEGFDWETAPWFDANGLNDVPSMSASTQLEKLQNHG